MNKGKKDIWFWIFTAVAAILFFVMPLMSRDAGNSGDEDSFQIPQGRNVVNYFKTNGQDSTCLTFNNLKYYGSSFDVIIEYFNEIFHIEDISTSRHIFNSFFGWLSVLMVGLIAYEIGGFRAGVLAMLLLFLSPRFLGHSFNNPKDVPFAAAVITAIWGMIRFCKQFPKVKWHTYLILILSIAFSISVRIGGLILFGYFGLIGMLCLIRIFAEERQQLLLTKKKKISLGDYVSGKMILKMLVMGLGICIVGYFAGLLLWPYALQSPIKNPWEAFKLMSSFDVSIRQLFEGQRIWSNAMPWYYTPKYIFSTIPIAVIIGLLLFFVFCWREKEERFWSFFLFFTFFFPVFWIVYTHANVYGGWRHAIFAYPPMAAAAGLGFDGLLKWMEKKFNKPIAINVGGMVVFLLLLFGPIRHIAANHPYEYVYFNELFGGMKKAYGNYETDYYYHSTREAVEWVIQNAEPKEDGSKIQVNSWHLGSIVYFLRNDTAKFKAGFSRWGEREYDNWDYAIFTVTGMQGTELKNKDAFPPKNCVKTIDVDGYPICIILKKEKINYGKMGHDYLTKFQQHRLMDETGRALLDTAKTYFAQALEQNPYNQSVLGDLISLHLSMRQLDSAKYYLDRAMTFLADDEIVNYNQGLYYLYANDPQAAISSFKKVCKLNSKFKGGYTMLYSIYENMQDWKNAEKVLLDEIEIGQFGNQEFQQLMGVYAHLGLDSNSALKKIYKALYEACLRQGNKALAEEYLEAYNNIKKSSVF